MPNWGYGGGGVFAVPLHRQKLLNKHKRLNFKNKSREYEDNDDDPNANVLLLL